MNSCPKIHIEILFFGHVTDTQEKKFPAGQRPPPTPSTGGTPPIDGGAPELPRRGSPAGAGTFPETQVILCLTF